MIVKRNFSPIKVWQYTRKPMLFVIAWTFLVWVTYSLTSHPLLVLNFTPVGVLGSALAIFIAFRNNSSYARWWEARQIWGTLVNHSREFARMVINFVDVCIRAQPERISEMDAFKKELIERHIAFVHSLRLHLRRQENWEILLPFLKKEEYDAVVQKQNKPNFINMLSGGCLRKGQDKKMLEWFHTFQIEGNLTQFAHHLGNCERIKNTPLPRQYDFFTRVFVIIFSALLPLGLLSFFQSERIQAFDWMIIPLAILIGGVFVIMERTGEANENPFENKITDIPMTSLCNTIERDLKEMLGEAIPDKIKSINGYID